MLFRSDENEDAMMKFVTRESLPRIVWFRRSKHASDLLLSGRYDIHVCLFVADDNDPYHEHDDVLSLEALDFSSLF